MAEQNDRTYRRQRDPGLRIQRMLVRSDSPEEILFKINELLSAGSSRKNVRVPVTLPVNYRAADKDFSGSSYTLSQGGMFIKSPEPLAEDTVVEVTMTLPGDEGAIWIEGKVVERVSPDQAREKSGISGMAVVFRKIKTGDQRRIDRFVRSRARHMYTP
jgi:uncharacterized protein (TIGR02266 family)